MEDENEEVVEEEEEDAEAEKTVGGAQDEAVRSYAYHVGVAQLRLCELEVAAQLLPPSRPFGRRVPLSCCGLYCGLYYAKCP